MKFDYPQELPVSAAREEIAAAIRSSQVVIVSGQTGSGKTTQIPKILLELGRGTHGHQIVHTQPRRIAARTVAERIASELEVPLGKEIGYQVRFTDESSPDTRLRVVTDGILLAQIQRDPTLSKYDTIIIDEAHERSLNIDFLLGYFTALLPQRRDLKLVITSATIDSVKFKAHFEEALHTNVPVIEVSGRTYPVQILYEPLDGAPSLMNFVPGFRDVRAQRTVAGELRNSSQSAGIDDIAHSVGTRAHEEDMPTAVARACAELVIHSSHDHGARDILVFASGERDIHDFEAALRHHFGPRVEDMRRPDAIEIMPLFARLSAKDQHRIFETHTHQRIVIATNVAETSLTVPGIRYVVDPGTARISRYSKNAKVQRLPIEPISQASADQRSGRCGRIADGIAIRLYSREDYETRPRFTEPEILRTSLGAVVLHMLSVGVARNTHDVVNFGFIDPPDVKAVSDGFNELTELHAIARKNGQVVLTRTGKQLARIPIDIRLGRMVIQAAQTTTPNTLAAVLVIVAFLSLQDPREHPDEAREEASRMQQRYADSSSDFLTAINLWDYAFQADGNPSNGALRKFCKTEYLNFLRMRQWKDLVVQLQDMCKELHFTLGEPLPVSRPDLAVRQLPPQQQAAHSLCCSWDSQGIHSAMLSGLLSMIGMQATRTPKASDFTGLKGAARARAMKRAEKQSKNEYQGARGTHFSIFPASAVAKTTPEWVMSTELVETSRLWARYCATIDPAWAEPLAGTLTRTTYAEPHWSASRGCAVASATVLLYGLPIVRDRTVQWGHIQPAEARDFLIRQGLVEGDIHQRFSYDDFLLRNISVLEAAAQDAHRTRQIAQSVSEEDLFDFYHAVLPTHLTSLAELAKWWKQEHDRNPDLLNFDPDKVERLQHNNSYSPQDYPDFWKTIGTDGSTINLALSYVYDPHSADDGVTVHIPLQQLSRLTPDEFSWNVPGLLDELIIGLIKSLPKSLRVQFVPAPDTARSIREYIDQHYPTLPGIDPNEVNIPFASSSSEMTAATHTEQSLEQSEPQSSKTMYPPFTQVFTQAAIAVVGAQIHPEVFSEEQIRELPAYLTMSFRIEQTPSARHEQNKGRRRKPSTVSVLGSGKSLLQLQQQFAEQAQASARKVVRQQAEHAGEQGKLVKQANLLHNAGATTQSRASMLWEGALNSLRLPSERISSRWLGVEALQLAAAPYPSTSALVDDLQLAAVKRLLPHIEHAEDDSSLAQDIADVEQVYEDAVYSVAQDVIVILKQYAQVDKAISGPADLPMLNVLQSIRKHIHTLVFKGFIGAAPPQTLPLIHRYLQADLMRLQKAKVDKNRDVRWAWQADEAYQLVETAKQHAESSPAGPQHEALQAQADEARWMLEELYISLWAQELGTSKPVSIQRLHKLLESSQ